jgi:uncharacterized membrane protein
MPKISVVTGFLLSILGLYGYYGMEKISVTALIPLFLGVPIIVLGVLAFDEKKLKHTMHAASMLVLLGLLGSVYRIIQKSAFTNLDEASVIIWIMILVCIIFLVLAIKSFIDARKAREANQGVK